MFINCLAVGAGGFIGSILRYLIGLIPFIHRAGFPLPTFIANVMGALLIGFIIGYVSVTGSNTRWELFLRVGICGGFTTFSTFSLESFYFLEEGHWALGIGYMAASMILCLAGVWAGMALGRAAAA